MKTIWKLTVPVEDRPQLVLPKGSRILSVQATTPQKQELTVWALVDTPPVTADPLYPGGEYAEVRTLAVVGTGNPTHGAERGQYLGTVQIPPFVWHVFDVTESRHAG